MPPIFTIEKREEIKTNLLDAGIALIKENGIRKTSIEMITKKARIGKGTFYHFFNSKEEFISKLIHYSKENIYNYVNKIIETRGEIDKKTFIEILKYVCLVENNNITFYLKSDDEQWIATNLSDEFGASSEKKRQIMDNMFQYFIDTKEDINYLVIENILNIIACTFENRMIMNENALAESITLIIEALGNYIFNA